MFVRISQSWSAQLSPICKSNRSASAGPIRNKIGPSWGDLRIGLFLMITPQIDIVLHKLQLQRHIAFTSWTPQVQIQASSRKKSYPHYQSLCIECFDLYRWKYSKSFPTSFVFPLRNLDANLLFGPKERMNAWDLQAEIIGDHDQNSNHTRHEN